MPLVDKGKALHVVRATLKAYEDDDATRDDLQGALLECRDASRHWLLFASQADNPLDRRADAANRAATALMLQQILEEKLASTLDPLKRCESGRKSDHSRCPKEATRLATYPSGATLRLCKTHAKPRPGTGIRYGPLGA